MTKLELRQQQQYGSRRLNRLEKYLGKIVGRKISSTITVENNLAVPQKVRQSYHITQQFHLRYIPERTENIRSHKNVYINVYSGIIQNSQKEEITQMPIKWTDKQNKVYPYNRVLFNQKKEWSKSKNIDETWKHHPMWRKPDTKGHVLYDSLYMK